MLLSAPPRALLSRCRRQQQRQLRAAAAAVSPHAPHPSHAPPPLRRRAALHTAARSTRCASSSADNIAAGPVGDAQAWEPPPQQPPVPARGTAAADVPMLAEFSAFKWYECVVGVLYAILMSEARAAPLSAAAAQRKNAKTTT
jgi:hypothetical protein